MQQGTVGMDNVISFKQGQNRHTPAALFLVNAVIAKNLFLTIACESRENENVRTWDLWPKQLAEVFGSRKAGPEMQ